MKKYSPGSASQDVGPLSFCPVAYQFEGTSHHLAGSPLAALAPAEWLSMLDDGLSDCEKLKMEQDL